MARLFLPPILFIEAIIAMAVLHGLWPLTQWVSGPVRWSGLVLILMGGLLTVGQAGRFRRQGANVPSHRPPTQFIHDGVYRFSRNPMYLGFVLALVGIWVLLGSAGALLPVVGFSLIMNFGWIPFEERHMRRCYGEGYHQYCQRVRRWI